MGLKGVLRRAVRNLGFDVVRLATAGVNWPADFTQSDREIIERVRGFSMTSIERLYAVIHAVDYVILNQVPGDLVECGVWQGGSMMAVALELLRLRDTTRRLYLYDTFTGMTPPTAEDVDLWGNPMSEAVAKWGTNKEGGSNWGYAPEQQVRWHMASTHYPEDRIVMVRGPVEETLPRVMPDHIGLLRLDTDWYGSTRYELEHLFPLLVTGGVLIIDDYGHHLGQRRAVDEYFRRERIQMLLCRVDYTGRIGLKQ